MMTSVGSERTRGTREKTQIPAAQPTQPQKPVVQATAEQIRLAQMIYDKNDADFEDKVKQLMEVTGKNQDDCIVALHDCNGDVNRAINLLLEGSSDTTSWETVGVKKKSLGKESSENKENREKRGDREGSRGRGTSNRRGRGGSRGRECKSPDFGLQGAGWQIYGYDDLQMLQSRLPVDYYGITFPAPANLTSRDGALANNPYSGDIAKFGRGDSASPVPATTLAQAQQNQNQAHHTAQQAFLNPTLPPGYSYTGLPYYAGVPGVPSAFQYGPTMFVPPASAKQHSVTLNAASTPFQQAGSYSQHSYGAGYDDLTQGTVAGDYSKGPYVAATQAQNKSAGGGAGKGNMGGALFLTKEKIWGSGVNCGVLGCSLSLVRTSSVLEGNGDYEGGRGGGRRGGLWSPWLLSEPDDFLADVS
uniref:UBA domain-containing protein n=1 Tax=Pseudonaja textilis TaxID=8673 RepID=A0A670YVH0_PSETE